ncbi:hypothetical protein [Streptomyces beihaiensis]|uniref:hypothetical protein n=1 Tax=Streptomyces beihaiensis TaxID=2984495 RepID=UPI002B1CAF19|nr:hypothetical protein [Streptomyces beihaiensis]
MEEQDGKPVVYVYELDPATNSYAKPSIHHDRLKVGVPFPLAVELALQRRTGRAPEEPGAATVE